MLNEHLHNRNRMGLNNRCDEVIHARGVDRTQSCRLWWKCAAFVDSLECRCKLCFNFSLTMHTIRRSIQHNPIDFSYLIALGVFFCFLAPLIIRAIKKTTYSPRNVHLYRRTSHENPIKVATICNIHSPHNIYVSLTRWNIIAPIFTGIICQTLTAP